MSDIATPAAPSAPVPTQRTLTEPVKAGIREAYAKLQANTPGFATRRAQSQMIGLVSRALATSGGIGVAEAPTGVGKSLGYLTAGVPIALATKKKLVISTGTVALQSQLVERDIPAFLKATGLEATVALAKGRTRYLCTRNAAELEGETSQNGMFEDEQVLYDRPLSPADADLAKRLAKAYAARTWNGDLDDAPSRCRCRCACASPRRPPAAPDVAAAMRRSARCSRRAPMCARRRSWSPITPCCCRRCRWAMPRTASR